MHIRSILIAAGAAALSSTAHSDIQFNGFASVVTGQTLSSDESYFGYDDDNSFKPESLFALQARADLLDGLSATAQVIAYGSNSFDADFSWAYVSYEVNDEFTLRAGCMRLPFYQYSDYLDVGYAYPWIRPSTAMYNLPFSNYDGLGFIYSTSAGDWDLGFNAIYGGLDDTFFQDELPTDGRFTDAYGINFTFSRDWFSGYLSYFGSGVTIPLAPVELFANQLEEAGVPSSTTSLLRIDDDDAQFFGGGINMDFDNWFAVAEYSSWNIDDSALDESNDAWYISAGYRFDSVTPFIMYETLTIDPSEDLTSQLPSFPIPGAGIPVDVAAQLLINGINRADFDIWSVGLRYDFHSNAAFKIEYNSVDSDFDDANDADLISIAVDLIF